MNLSNLTRRVVKLFFALAIVATFSGCGGGSGGGGGDGGQNDQAGVSSNANASITEVASQDLDDLQVDLENKLLSAAELEVLAQVSSDRSFLTICAGDDFQADINQVDYEDCILRAPLDDAPASFNLTVPNHIDELVAIVWFYQADKQPLVRKWRRSSNAGVSIEEIWHVTDQG